jgi:hypothetical protein
MVVRDQQGTPLTHAGNYAVLPGLSPVSGKTITATFDGGTLSSNGGVLILCSISARCSVGTSLTIATAKDSDDLDATRTAAGVGHRPDVATMHQASKFC